MSRAVGNEALDTLAKAIGSGKIGENSADIQGITNVTCGNGITVNKATGMLEVPIGEHLRYTGGGLDVPEADETTAGVVKLTHEVSNRGDGERAITADGVFAYTLGYIAPPATINPVLAIKGGITYCRAIPGLIICEFFVTNNLAAGDMIMSIDGYAADVSRIFEREYFTLENTPTAIHVKSLGDMADGDYRLIVPAHKL